MNKKAQVLENLGGLAVGIATFAIIMVVAFLVISNTQSQTKTQGGCDASGYTYNATGDTCCNTAGSCTTGYSNALNASRTLQSASATIPGWIPLIVIIVIGAAILGMIAMFKR